MKQKTPENSPVSHREALGRKPSPVEEAFGDMQLMLKRIVARLVANPTDVEDILQDTYVKAVTGEATTAVRNPRAYLVTVARSVALNDLAKKSRQIAESIEAAGGLSVISDEPSAEERLIEDDKLQALRDATATLPQQCRRER
jgi:RNA polymerase sigma-70 factor (ECF subfamily)